MYQSGTGYKSTDHGNISRKEKSKNMSSMKLVIRSGSQLIWLWIVIEPIDKEIFSFHISKEQNMFVAERVLSEVVEMYRKHQVSSDGGTWYPQVCKFLDLYHHLHSSFEKSIIERTVHYKR